MKKWSRVLPVLLLLLVVLWLMPAGGQDASPAQAPEATAALSEILPSADLSSLQSEAVSATDAPAETVEESDPVGEPEEALLDENGSYTTKEDVAAYLLQYGKLPANFVTKKEAQAAGWEGGSLEAVLPGKCIGGDRFGNYEGLLPSAKGRTWTECDLNTLGKRSRGPERLVFSNDGLIYYTGDHYKSFERLY